MCLFPLGGKGAYACIFCTFNRKVAILPNCNPNIGGRMSPSFNRILNTTARFIDDKMDFPEVYAIKPLLGALLSLTMAPHIAVRSLTHNLAVLGIGLTVGSCAAFIQDYLPANTGTAKGLIDPANITTLKATALTTTAVITGVALAALYE